MISLRLDFSRQGDEIALAGTKFSAFQQTHSTIRGNRSPTPGIGTFPWSYAVQGLCVLFLKHAAQRFLPQNESPGLAQISGAAGSLAASLDYAISKNPQWLADMFGTDRAGEPNFRRMVRRINPERKRPGPVEVYVNSSYVSPVQVEITLDSLELTSSDAILALAEKILERHDKTLRKGLALADPERDRIEPKVQPAGAIENVTRVLFFFTVSIKRPYFAELLEACSGVFHEYFGSAIEPIFRAVPDRFDYQADAALVELMKEVPKIATSSKCVVVVPTWSEHFTEAIAALAQSCKIEVIAFTLQFHDSRPFSVRGLPIPPLVISNNFKGAMALGERAADHISKSKRANPDPNVILIPGHQNRVDSLDRLRGFSEGIKNKLPATKFTQLAECLWSRQKSAEACAAIIKSSRGIPDVIFAANDQMALGARDAFILALTKGEVKKSEAPIICGYDAVDEFRLHLENDCPFLFGSVAQDLNGLARALAEVISKLIVKGKRSSTLAPILVEPQVVARIDASKIAEPLLMNG